MSFQVCLELQYLSSYTITSVLQLCQEPAANAEETDEAPHPASQPHVALEAKEGQIPVLKQQDLPQLFCYY